MSLHFRKKIEMMKKQPLKFSYGSRAGYTFKTYKRLSVVGNFEMFDCSEPINLAIKKDAKLFAILIIAFIILPFLMSLSHC